MKNLSSPGLGFSIVIFQGIFLVTDALGCSVPGDSKLNNATGEIRYSFGYRDSCRWEFQRDLDTDVVLVIRLGEVNLKDKKNKCTGSLTLPGFLKTCRWSPTHCHFYQLDSSQCDRRRLLMNEAQCKDISWHITPKGEMDRINFWSGQNVSKNFNLTYTYIQCPRSEISTMTTSLADYTVINTSRGPSTSPRSGGIVYIAVACAVSGVLVIVSLIMLGFCLKYRALVRKMKINSDVSIENEYVITEPKEGTAEIVTNVIYEESPAMFSQKR